MISFFALCLSCLNAGARVIYAMGRHGIFHAATATAHAQNETPHIAVTVMAAIAFGVPALATINIVPAPTVTAVGPDQNSNGVALSFTGLSNATYSVLASTDLTNWTRIGAASQPSTGQFFFYDTSVTNLPQRFFRIRSP